MAKWMSCKGDNCPEAKGEVNAADTQLTDSMTDLQLTDLETEAYI